MRMSHADLRTTMTYHVFGNFKLNVSFKKTKTCFPKCGLQLVIIAIIKPFITSKMLTIVLVFQPV